VRALIFGLVGIAALLLLPDLGPGPLNATDPVVRATVIAVRSEQVEVQLLEGPRAGERLTLPAGDEADTMVALPEAGEEYLVYLPQPGDATPAALAERYRFVPMLIAAAVVAFAAVAIGGAAGIRSLVALLFSGLLILRVTIPLLLTGAPALPVAMGSAITVAATTILIARGPGRSAAAAIIGMTIALTIAAAASEGAAALAGLSDIRGAADLYPLIGVLAGLSMAAVLITATALIDDVAVTQVAAVEQLRLADRRMSDATVTAQAMAVGRAHAGALLNTIVIVWIGGSLPLVAALTMAGERADIILSTEVVAAELLRIAAGVIGTIAAIPATTYAAVRLGVGRP
jgi:uncharacterized membrane protein